MLFILTGKSGSGKSTIANKLPIERVKTLTSRTPRKGEVNGVDYYFISIDQFNQMISEDKLAEWELFGDNYYGIFKSDMNIDQIPKVIVLDYKGAHKLRVSHPDKTRWVNINVDDSAVNNRLLERDGQQLSLSRAKNESENKVLLESGLVNHQLSNNGCLMNTVVQLFKYITVETWGID